MKENIDRILDMVGLDNKSIQVLDFDQLSIIYPNFFTTRDIIDKGQTDEELLQEIEDLIVEHMLDVQHDLQMIKRCKELF